MIWDALNDLESPVHCSGREVGIGAQTVSGSSRKKKHLKY